MKHIVSSTHNNTIFYFISDSGTAAHWTDDMAAATRYTHPDDAENIVRRLRRVMITRLATIPVND